MYYYRHRIMQLIFYTIEMGFTGLKGVQGIYFE